MTGPMLVALAMPKETAPAANQANNDFAICVFMWTTLAQKLPAV